MKKHSVKKKKLKRNKKKPDNFIYNTKRLTGLEMRTLYEDQLIVKQNFKS